jgi:hypothetical protein
MLPRVAYIVFSEDTPHTERWSDDWSHCLLHRHCRRLFTANPTWGTDNFHCLVQKGCLMALYKKSVIVLKGVHCNIYKRVSMLLRLMLLRLIIRAKTVESSHTWCRWDKDENILFLFPLFFNTFAKSFVFTIQKQMISLFITQIYYHPIKAVYGKRSMVLKYRMSNQSKILRCDINSEVRDAWV